MSRYLRENLTFDYARMEIIDEDDTVHGGKTLKDIICQK